MPGAGSREIELAAKLDSVEREFEYWLAQSDASAPLEKHYTQVRRVTGALRAFADGVREEVATERGRQKAALLVLDLHQIWDFFRVKLALRCVPWFERPLVAADDYAWACYRPATLAAIRHGFDEARVREPPLVALSADAVARAHARGGSYAELIVDGLYGPALLPALRELPLPVIALPWYQVEHVPDALAIGHEVGHLLEQDLDLAPVLRSLLVSALGAGAAHLRDWEAWLGEVFADVYGCLAAGPGYASWLLDLLADPAFVATPGAGGDQRAPYPPRAVRASLVLACITRLGFASEAADLREAWSADHGDGGSSPFRDEIDPVVAAILEGPYPVLGGRLASVLSFSRLEHEAAVDEARRLLRGDRLEVRDVRVLLAAGAHAFRSDPQAFRSRVLGSRVLDRAVSLRRRGVRSAVGTRPLHPSVRVADEEAGRRLLDQVRVCHREVSGGVLPT